MAAKRHFLDWTRPALHVVADWLLSQTNPGRNGDLSEVLVVTATHRAAGRLMELLVARTNGGQMLPPHIVTVTNLPEHLFKPHKPIADDWVATHLRMRSLMQLSQSTLKSLFPHLPDQGDIPAWWSLAKQVNRLDDEVAAAGLRFEQIIPRAAQLGWDLHDEVRWHVLAQIQSAYLQLVTDAGLCDRNDVRIQTIEQNRCRFTDRLVLAVVADLNMLTKSMLDQAAHHDDARIDALIHAPDCESAGFDAMGGLIVDYWQNSNLRIESKALVFVDRVQDQAMAIVDAVSEFAGPDKAVDPDDVTIAMCDECEVDRITHTLHCADLPARNQLGKSVANTRPAMMLEALAGFIQQHRFDDLANLLRHPDIERYINEQCPDEDLPLTREADCDHKQAVTDWLTLLDTYANDHLQGNLTGNWLGDPNRQRRLKAVYDTVTGLIPFDRDRLMPLSQWAGCIMEVLNTIYGHLTLDHHEYRDHLMFHSLARLAGHLNDQASLSESIRDPVDLTASQAIAILLSHLAGDAVADLEGEAAVELVQFRESHLDDSPCLIVTTVNESYLPASKGDDTFLPDSLKKRLGMSDSTGKYARDMMMLKSILHSRPYVKLIATRHDTSGSPLLPSRLILSCDDLTLKSRVLAFFTEPVESPVIILPHKPASDSRFLLPKPDPLLPMLNQLPVTAFRDYLTCPYRFYLKWICHLKGLDDHAIELDQLTFGSLAHEVLKVFGRSDLIASTDEQVIYGYLSKQLDQLAVTSFGTDMRPAVRIQIEQLRLRLRQFATLQASLVTDGWRIVPNFTESRLKADVIVDNQPFTIIGRVDRIDHHPNLGYRILDYKTSDTGKSPRKVHMKSGQWIDLQLPLYYDLCQPLGLTGNIELGYLNLPKKCDDVKVMDADWSESELADAISVRNSIIRSIRQRQFWPPNEPPVYCDPFTFICADNAYNRRDIINVVTENLT